MNKLFIKFFAIILLFSACKPDVIQFTINGRIKGAAGKHLKIIDMTKPGLSPDSIELDMGGKFTFNKVSNQPGDYIMYFTNTDFIRVTPLPNEIIGIEANHNNLLSSVIITGSAETEQVIQILLKHKNTLHTIDTLNSYYMQHQTHPEPDSLIKQLTHIRDSVITAEKVFLEQYIEKHPGTFASYIALSQKIGQHLNLFTLENDLKYFEMVDTALYNRFDTIAISNMLNAYVKRGKIELKRSKTIEQSSNSMIGEQAPNIILPNPYGDTLNLETLRGKYVLVDFWGSWCRPCRKEHPNLRTAYWRYRKKGFDVFQVAIEHNKTDWKNCIKEDKLNWKNHVSDLNYMESETAKKYNVNAMPANFLINTEGKIIAQNLYGDALLNKLGELFPYKPKPAPVVQKDSAQPSTLPNTIQNGE